MSDCNYFKFKSNGGCHYYPGPVTYLTADNTNNVSGPKHC